MLKKILLTSIALSLCLSANSNLNENIDCEAQFESCVTKCEDIHSDEKNQVCVELCESVYEKCQLSLEDNVEIPNEDDMKEALESQEDEDKAK
ncbi:hypothetical protein [Poseidonibacter ostreae]|jgi:hypothetical protein|uniref:Uncharacterized protein n=1 Tax=Poseidonibacter ostreae TaxID=2654171 RepID=A0A6L4WT45_9BACT|nr:hypothetical protein [Poseidonibacter ostreae]KAB7882003.1 hypothetical protein GA417_13775 [Poseidonibacter ostreae]KAB7886618.1 hypothetical protein GBG19_11805 [Poseidonibacter ostreae]KAB7889228.1 hypothetical protein GBG18_11345 [Poseidonibacter ostreae]MAC82657.1 hypothetical protein [Arcobacter sp.]|tara:strand:- start:996 stop:1274 length:279 start_codon:yes stop_codon:yes gene_type:complete